MEEELTEAEREQIRRFAALQRVAWEILVKWKWVFLLSVVVLSVAFSVFLVWRSARSAHRFDAVTRLLFNPRKVSRVDSMSDKQLMTIIERDSLKRRVGRKMRMTDEERKCLKIDLGITQERRPSNLFTLTANASSWVGAVKKVNAYAEVLIEEYITYRTQDLNNWRESILLRKKKLQEQIAEIESEESIAKGKTGVTSPVETLTTLNALLSDQRRNLSMLSVQIMNEEVKKRKLEATVGDLGPAIVNSAAIIRQKSSQLAEIDKELTQLREIYTDINPKVLGKLDDRNALMGEYTELLKERGIDGLTLEDVERVEKAASELAEVSLKMEVLRESQRSLEQEIQENEKRSSTLTAIIPSVERLRIKRVDLEETMRSLEDQLDEISYLQMATGNDLRQIERAGGAGDKNPLRVKNFAFAIGGAVICTGVLAFWIMALEFIFGKVRSSKELAAYDDVIVLGSLPKPGALPEDEEKDLLGVVALNFCNAEVPKGIILVCRMPGSPPQPKFQTALDWSLSMAGQRPFLLHIVPSLGFEPPEGAEPMITAFRKGSVGWFPVANRYSLAPTELQMLQADLATLREEFDCIFMLMPGGMRRGGSFFAQLLGVCESAFLLVGAEATPRTWLAYTRRHVSAAAKPMVGLVTGVSARVAHKEMEAKK